MKVTLKTSCSKDQIKKELAKLRAEIKKRQSELKVLGEACKHYQGQCDHAGQQTGHNERDGSWGNPCPTCGYSY